MSARAIATVGALLLAASVGTPHLGAQALPEGPGLNVVKAKCLGCHESDLIVQQRLSRTGWEREVDKMVRWGAKVEEAERAPLVDYLAAHFAAKPMTAHAAAAPPTGEATYKSACLTCHQDDLITQQRLSRTGWVREVDKMIRWGAKVPDAEKDALVDYLAGRFR